MSRAGSRAESRVGSRPVQPRAAAGVVLLRETAAGPEVLLGRRSARTRFMPGIYVFPGGRLDPDDRRASGFPEPPQSDTGLDVATRRLLPALRRAALRETWEETGLLLAAPANAGAAAATTAPLWRRYGEAGRVPAFGALRLLARAITPPSSPIRYHTRFFLCRAETVALEGDLGGDGELEDLAWRPAAALDALPMADVTHAVLAEALARARRPGGEPARLFLYRHGRIRSR